MSAPMEAVIKKLTAFTINNEDGSSLTWSIRNGYPRITVFLDKDQNGKSGIIIAKFDAISLQVALTAFLDVINSTEDKVAKFNCSDIKYEDNVKTNEKYVQATVAFINKGGVISIALRSNKGVTKKYDILPSAFVAELDKDGNPITEIGTASTTWAKAYVTLLSKMITVYAATFDMKAIKQEVPASTVTVNNDIEDELF